MPTPSKFLMARQARIVELLAAGASLREAARGAGISHRTLGRWIEQGREAHPEGRWHQFFLEVEAARAGGPELRALKARWESPDLGWLQKFIDAEWKLDPPTPAPSGADMARREVEVRLSDGTPLGGAPVYDPAERSPA